MIFSCLITAQLHNQTGHCLGQICICDNLKAEARSKRGKGVRRHVMPSIVIPENWFAFLRIDDNKSVISMATK